MAGGSSFAPAAAAETDPRLVPTSHTGLPSCARNRSAITRRSSTWSPLARNARVRSSWSLGLPITATLKPASANMSRVRTRKFFERGGSPFTTPMPPSPPGRSITVAVAPGRSMSQ
jgi:hypothetical protein